MWARAGSAAQDAAVVDIGSNSVRLVIYRLEGRAVWTVFNEKVLAGLGKGVHSTGRLSPEGVAEALSAIRRFRAVLDAAEPEQLFAVATAAVRDSRDGGEFVQRILDQTGLKIRILSGEEEARYSALGVIAGCPHAEGVAGDLGGSSLELIRIGGGEVGTGVTLPLGPFALGAPADINPGQVRKLASKRLDEVADRFRAETFHAVGGAWRSLAQIHMAMSDYPLRIVHLYEMSARDAVDAARFVAKQSKGSLERVPGLSKKRAETLPYAACVLEELIEHLGYERLSISAYGVREGMLFEAMASKLRTLDPLVEGCAALGGRQGVAEGLGAALAAWLKPALAALPPVFENGRDQVLLEAACRLADVGARLHPDHRADLAFAQVLRAPIAGQSHPERAYLAQAVHSRYGGGAAPEPYAVRRVLTEERVARAKALGLAMRLGADLSGRAPELLEHCALSIARGRLTLAADSAWADMLLGEQTAKRGQALASALDLQWEARAA